MILFKTFILISVIFPIIASGILVPKKLSLKVADFVENVIDNSQNSQVVLIKLGLLKNSARKLSEIYETVISRISDRKIVLLPEPSRITHDIGMKSDSIVIIVGDVFNTVSKSSRNLNYKVFSRFQTSKCIYIFKTTD